jgi:phosphonate transport system substrate-binding protein
VTKYTFHAIARTQPGEIMHVLLALALAAQPAMPAGGADDLLLKVGEPAPPFSMRDLEKKTFSLADHVGPDAREPKKAVLMAFFATWCEPCKKEIPIVKEVYKAWAPKGVQVVYVGLSQGAKDLEPFAKQVSFEWPVLPDAFGLLGRRYGASQLPHVFIIDAEGRVAFQHRGIAPDLKAELDSQLVRVTGERQSPLSVSAHDAVVRERFARKLRLGRVPAQQASAARWQPLAAYVGELANAEVVIGTEATYDAFEAALKAGKYDIANAGPLVLSEVTDKYEPTARIERQGVPTYQGIVFALRSGGVTRLADLKGKRIGLVSDRSTSGGLYTKLALLQAGLNPDKDVQLVWLGSHEKVAAAVKAGEVEAGGCFEDCRDAAWATDREKATATRIIAYTAPIPGEMIVVRRDLDPKTKQAIRQALLSLNDAAGILAQISQGELPVTAFTAATEKDLVAVQDVVKKVSKK